MTAYNTFFVYGLIAFCAAALLLLYRKRMNIRERSLAIKHLREPGAGQQIIFEHARTAYVLVDTEMQVVTFNHRASSFTRSIFGKELKKETHAIDYFPQDRKKPLKNMFIKAFSGIESGYETEYVNDEGSVMWYDVKIYGTTTSEKTTGAIIAVRDITAKKSLELQRENMTAELIQHNRNLEQFAYIVSHNLRAPLANIIGLAEVLAMPGLDNAQRHDFIGGIASSAQKLDEVIIDLDHILHMRNSDNEQKEQVSLEHILENVKVVLKNAMVGSSVTIHSNFNDAPFIYGIKSYIHSIFYNLVSNSIKYRNKNKDLLIEISSNKCAAGTVLSFKDNGLGIDLERSRDKIFGLYKRFHPDIEGKGMGLFMTRTQVEKLGGRMSVESNPGAGATFKIQFL